ncbi:MAG: F0F1 ATP synthase subunit A [Muribaculaceae bacterium]|nr:F0F1 ATP synthase subunit A [Muribaculaceae bacterium]
MNRIVRLLILALALIVSAGPAFATETEKEAEEALNPKETIFEHLGDGYGWEVPFNHHVRMPLPVIVKVKDGGWHVFSSKRIDHGQTYDDNGTLFRLAGKDSEFKGKVVVVKDGKEFKPQFDISITKNVAAIFITIIVVVGLLLWLASWHKRNPYKAPRKGLGFIELLVTFIYDSVVKSTLKDKAPKFAPYLMTVFFFIFFMNILGLVVVFPGGANLTGNIAVTLVLAILTFLVTNLFATKHYWKEIFWPDVPLWLKFPLPIMPMIEIFGMFTKPAALTVRLFANMMGGHMIVLVLTLLIFIFAAVNPVAGGATTVVSVLFSVFMLLIDVLVSFIQAYVFTMLSTIFISLAQEHEHKEDEAKKAEKAHLKGATAPEAVTAGANN